MPNKKTGQLIPCCVCGTEVYKTKAYLARGYQRITCGNIECKSKSVQGEHNPFWGKIHNDEARIRIRAGRRANPPKTKTGPPVGYKHTAESRKKITEALKVRWAEKRDVMLSYNPPLNKPREEQRYRRQFTPVQRRDWRDPSCAWCKSTEDLVLDHIIPVLCGGNNDRRNCQTLCRACNLWKMVYVDKPLFLAGLVESGGRS